MTKVSKILDKIFKIKKCKKITKVYYFSKQIKNTSKIISTNKIIKGRLFGVGNNVERIQKIKYGVSLTPQPNPPSGISNASTRFTLDFCKLLKDFSIYKREESKHEGLLEFGIYEDLTNLDKYILESMVLKIDENKIKKKIFDKVNLVNPKKSEELLTEYNNIRKNLNNFKNFTPKINELKFTRSCSSSSLYCDNNFGFSIKVSNDIWPK